MKRGYLILSTVVLMFLLFLPVSAASHQLRYRLKPGQVWQTHISSQNETTFMGKKNVNRSKTLIEYRVSSGSKKGWISVTAQIFISEIDVRQKRR